MNIAFTICSNNYFAHAKVLTSSFLKFNPDYRFIIGLVDKKSSQINYNLGESVDIITVEELEIDEKYQIFKKFDIIELNTSVKATYFKFIKKKYSSVSFVIYLDPDIAFFSSFCELEKMLSNYSIMLTPHINTPIEPDNLMPNENTFLNYGIYNLGFIAVNFDFPEVNSFLEWWEQRTLLFGYSRPCDGIFVDQLWINLVPVFFKNIFILNDSGYNMAPWNLHERKMYIDADGKFLIKPDMELIFYHFSSFNFNSPDRLSKSYTRYSFENQGELKRLYDWYFKQLINNDIEVVSKISCFYFSKSDDNYKENALMTLMKKIIKGLTPPLILHFFIRIRSILLKNK